MRRVRRRTGGRRPAGALPRLLDETRAGDEHVRQRGATSAPADYPPPTPAELAAYFPDLEILEFIGRGGMGMVYKARQKRLDRLVALKILSPKIGQDPAFAERFNREARAMAMLSHPHIVTVHDFGQRHSGREERGEGRGKAACSSQEPLAASRMPLSLRAGRA